MADYNCASFSLATRSAKKNGSEERAEFGLIVIELIKNPESWISG